MEIRDLTLPLLISKLWQKGLSFFYYLFFVMIKKPWYKFSYSWNGNMFCCKGVLRRCHVMMSGGNNSLIIAKTAYLNNVRIDISGHNNSLIISEGVSFSEGGFIRIQDNDNKIIIGRNTKIINAFFSSADLNTTIEIGEDCLFSNDIIIRSSDSHSLLNVDGKRINKGADVYIGNHVWICNGVRIMKGSKIGNNCVVGSNTIVSGQESHDNTLIVGSPARIIKENIDWSYERKYD